MLRLAFVMVACFVLGCGGDVGLGDGGTLDATTAPPLDAEASDGAIVDGGVSLLTVTGPTAGVLSVSFSGLETCASGTQHFVDVVPGVSAAASGRHGLFAPAGVAGSNSLTLDTNALAAPFAGNAPVGITIGSEAGTSLRGGTYTVSVRSCSVEIGASSILHAVTFVLPPSSATATYTYTLATSAGPDNWKHQIMEVRPSTLPANPRAVIVLHGFAGNGNSIQSSLFLDAAYLESRGTSSMSAVFPTGLGALSGWTNDQFTNVGVSDDVAFLDDLADYLLSAGYANVYLMGYSAGGEMAQLMYCKSSSGKFSGFGTISGPMNYAKHAGTSLQHCTPAATLPPLLMVQGDKDSTIGTTRSVAITTSLQGGNPTDVNSKMFVAGTAPSGSNYTQAYWNVCGNDTCSSGTNVAGQGWNEYDEAVALAIGRCGSGTPVASLAEPYSGTHSAPTSSTLTTDSFSWCSGNIKLARVNGGQHSLSHNWAKDWNQEFFDFFYAH